MAADGTRAMMSAIAAVMEAAWTVTLVTTWKKTAAAAATCKEGKRYGNGMYAGRRYHGSCRAAELLP